MTTYTTVGPSEAVGEGAAKAFQIGDDAIAVARVDGALYAFADVCSHRRCTLSTGELHGLSISCECHGSVFSIETGAVENPPATEPIAIYAVRDQDGQIQVEV